MEMQYMRTDRLDNHLQAVAAPAAPREGWLRHLRRTLNMNLQQLSRRLNVSKQSVARLEANEADGSITLRSLRRAAEAMDCQVVYAIVPKEGSLRALIEARAHKKAHALLDPVVHTMMLEDQEANNTQAQLQALIAEYVRTLPRDLWDE